MLNKPHYRLGCILSPSTLVQNRPKGGKGSLQRPRSLPLRGHHLTEILTGNSFSHCIYLSEDPGLNSGLQAWWRVPLPTEPSCPPRMLAFLSKAKTNQTRLALPKDPGKGEVSDRCLQGQRRGCRRPQPLKDGGRSPWVHGTLMPRLPDDVTVYKEDLHKAPQGPLRGEVFAWQYVPFPETSENPEMGVGPSRIPPAPNPDSREKLW